jgi:hypothetical protein
MSISTPVKPSKEKSTYQVLQTARESARRFARMRLSDEHRNMIDRPRVGQTLVIYLWFSGSDTTRKAARVSVAFATNRGTTLFICNNESADKDIMGIGRDDTLQLKIPELPLSAGTYRLRLYLERRLIPLSQVHQHLGLTGEI